MACDTPHILNGYQRTLIKEGILISMEIEIEGKKYYQPECHCIGAGHICYIRPVPQSVDVPIEKILAKLPIYGTK